MKKLVIGILAHVDAGKTTLSEGILYETGSIRQLGRVDKKDAFLDNYELERQRGITIFSKQARFLLDDAEVTLLDTPGHVDFSAEMERTLQVLDYAILVISGPDGIQGHTETLMSLLSKYGIPVFLFINKMDQPGADKDAILKVLKSKLSDRIVDFSETDTPEFYENIAVNDEEVLNHFLENDTVDESAIIRMIAGRQIFPCYFGSALKMWGIKDFLKGLDRYTHEPEYQEDFAARVFKITRDAQGNRLTHLKITGGVLKMKDLITYNLGEEKYREKVNQIRLYSGEKYENIKEAGPGSICAVMGLTKTVAGQGIGALKEEVFPYLEPVLTYEIIPPEDVSKVTFLSQLRQLEEEDPMLHIRFQEDKKEIYVQIMGDVQLEVLANLIKERFGIDVTFGPGSILYKETITDTVEGVGHFEPLKHYAEVHLLLTPLETGSGLQFAAECSEDLLSRNWQRLVLTHLEEKQHKGVLTGAPITDMKITLVSGRAHQKHTEGGDFREATYRAVRQGLMQAHSVLLEPYYQFRLEVPMDLVGRAMVDIKQMCGTCEVTESDGSISVLTGEAPVSEMNGYQKEVTSYTKGKGRILCEPAGYRPCHNQEEVIASEGYDPLADTANPPSSVFCSHGAGFVVPWEEVPDYMHLDFYLKGKGQDEEAETAVTKSTMARLDEALGTEEIDEILNKTFNANKKEHFIPHKGINRRNQKKQAETISSVTRKYKPVEKKEKYLLVDGYNVIYAWKELSALANENIDAARDKLLDILCNYQGIMQCNLIAVFDAYRIKGHNTEIMDYHNIHVVFTKEAETADAYIEKFTHQNGKKYDITVVTSDHLEQIIITGAGCHLISSREFEKEVLRANEQIREYLD